MVRGVSLAYGAYLLLPIVLLVIGSFGQNWTNTLLPNGATGQWYAELWHDAAFRRAFSTSLMVALAACAINAVLATPLAYALHRGERAGRAFAGRVVAAMPVAVPPITLGFGYLIVFNTDAMPWLGSTPLLIAAHAIATLPYLTNALLTDLRHLGLDRLEQAAATLGATEYQRFTGIVLPSLRQSLLSGLVMVAALSIGEFNLSTCWRVFTIAPIRCCCCRRSMAPRDSPAPPPWCCLSSPASPPCCRPFFCADPNELGL